MDEIRLEDGYLILANRLVEVMYSSNFNATQLKILLFVIRYTYGFKRKSHKISISFISTGTGISRRSIGQELRNLIESKVLFINEDHTATESREMSINKNYSQWIWYGSYLPQWKESSTVEPEFHTGMEPEFHTGMEATFHQEIKNKSKKESKERNNHDDLFERLWKEYPNKKGKSSIKQAAKKKLMVVGEEKMIQAINVYKRDLELNTWKQPMNGDTFFRGRYEDYLENQEEVKEHITKKLELKPFDPSQWE